jgi:hypothetical protein
MKIFVNKTLINLNEVKNTDIEQNTTLKRKNKFTTRKRASPPTIITQSAVALNDIAESLVNFSQNHVDNNPT